MKTTIPDGNNPTCDPSNLDKNRTVCGMIEVIQSGASNLAFLSGFIIAGFVSSVVNLWRTRRTAYCKYLKILITRPLIQFIVCFMMMIFFLLLILIEIALPISINNDVQVRYVELQETFSSMWHLFAPRRTNITREVVDSGL